MCDCAEPHRGPVALEQVELVAAIGVDLDRGPPLLVVPAEDPDAPRSSAGQAGDVARQVPVEDVGLRVVRLGEGRQRLAGARAERGPDVHPRVLVDDRLRARLHVERARAARRSRPRLDDQPEAALVGRHPEHPDIPLLEVVGLPPRPLARAPDLEVPGAGALVAEPGAGPTRPGRSSTRRRRPDSRRASPPRRCPGSPGTGRRPSARAGSRPRRRARDRSGGPGRASARTPGHGVRSTGGASGRSVEAR